MGIIQLENPPKSKEAIKAKLKESEAYWQLRLKIIEPFGMNLICEYLELTGEKRLLNNERSGRETLIVEGLGSLLVPIQCHTLWGQDYGNLVFVSLTLSKCLDSSQKPGWKALWDGGIDSKLLA